VPSKNVPDFMVMDDQAAAEPTKAAERAKENFMVLLMMMIDDVPSMDVHLP